MKHQKNGIQIAAVIVLFWPEDSIVDFVKEFSSQLKMVLVVNACSEENLKQLCEIDGVKIEYNDENIGLASGLNKGLRSALNFEPDFLFLLDQDSRPLPDLPILLVESFMAAKSNGLDPAAVGPTLVDVKDKISMRVANSVPKHHELIKLPTIASSGTLISKEVFHEVGPMLDMLFIDCIDHEWCFRAKSKGFSVFQNQNLNMQHDMGELGIWFSGRIRPVYKNPTRHYYIVRNTLYLSRLNYIPLIWKIEQYLKLLYRIPAYLYFSNKTSLTVRIICKAIVDAFKI